MRVIPKQANQTAERYFQYIGNTSLYPRCCHTCANNCPGCAAFTYFLGNYTLVSVLNSFYTISTENFTSSLFVNMGILTPQTLLLMTLERLADNHYHQYAYLYNTLSQPANTQNITPKLSRYIDSWTAIKRYDNWLAQAAFANALLGINDLENDRFTLKDLYKLSHKIKLTESFLKNWKIEGNDTPLCIQLNYALYRLKQSIEQMEEDETYDDLRINPHKSYLAHNTQLLDDMSQDHDYFTALSEFTQKNNLPPELSAHIFQYLFGVDDPADQNTQSNYRPANANKLAWQHTGKQFVATFKRTNNTNNHIEPTHESHVLNQNNDDIQAPSQSENNLHNNNEEGAQATHLPNQDYVDIEEQSQPEDNRPNNSIGNYLTSCLSSMFSRCCPRRQQGLQAPLLSERSPSDQSNP